MRFSRVFSLLLILSLLLVSVGCGTTASNTSAGSSTGSNSGNNTGSSAGGSGGKDQAQAPKPHGTPEKTKITIGLTVPGPSYIPIYTADLEGFFKQEGLDAKVTTFSSGADLSQAMASGSLDIGVGALAELLNAIDSGAKLKAFYGGFNQPEFRWYGKIASVKDGKGKRFSVTKFGSSTDFVTRYMLTVNGLNPDKDVQILQTGGGPASFAALDSGQVDVAIMAPINWENAEAKGYKLIGSQTDIAPDYPDHVWYATESFIKSNPETIKAVLRAFGKALVSDQANKDKAVQDLVTAMKYSQSDASKGYDDCIKYFFADGRLPSQKGMDTFWDMGIKTGQFTSKWPDSKWLDPTFINSYNEWK